MSIPVRYSIQETERKRMRFLKAASVSVGFAVSAAGIILATRGLKTIEFMHSLIEGELSSISDAFRKSRFWTGMR
jgi:hypothetical protein